MIIDVCSIREKQVISEIGNNKIYDVEVNPTIINQKILTNKIMYEGEVELSFLYSFESRVETKKVVVPFTFNVDSLEVNAKSTVETSIEVTLQDFTVMSDSNMDIKLDLEFNISLSNTQTINVIQEINIDENRECERYSLIIYFVKPGALQQEVRHGVQHQQVRAAGTDEDVPQLLPDDAHAHKAAQKIPVGQLFLLPENRPQAADGALAGRVLRFQPVREKQEQIPLRALVAAKAHVSRLWDARQPQQIQRLHLLLGA